MRVALLLSVLVAALVLVACGGGDSTAPTPTPLATSGVSTPDISTCSADDVQQTFDETKPLHDDYSTAFERGRESTSRSALTAAIRDMQRIHQAVRSADIPECAESFRTTFARAIDKSIEGFEGLAAGESDSTVALQFETATLLFNAATLQLYELSD